MLAPAVLAHRSADIFGYSKAASLFVTETDRRQALEDVFETLDAAESIVFLDTEATGNGEQARLIEVGMVEKSPEGELIGGMNFRCNPHRRSSGGARRVHGIADCELEHCREFAWYAKDFREALTGKVVVIHDPTNDIRWLNKEFRMLDPNAAPIESLCTVIDSYTLASWLPSERRRNGMDGLAAWYGFSRTASFHSAYGDADLLSKVFFELWWDLADFLWPQEEADAA